MRNTSHAPELHMCWACIANAMCQHMLLMLSPAGGVARACGIETKPVTVGRGRRRRQDCVPGRLSEPCAGGCGRPRPQRGGGAHHGPPGAQRRGHGQRLH